MMSIPPEILAALQQPLQPNAPSPVPVPAAEPPELQGIPAVPQTAEDVGDPLIQSLRQQGVPRKPEGWFKRSLKGLLQGFSDELTRDEREFQMQQEQTKSLADLRRSTGEVAKEGLEPVTLEGPDGTPITVPVKYAGPLIAGGFRVKTTQMQQAGATERAKLGFENKLQLASIRQLISSRKVARLVPAKAPDGSIGMMAMNQEGESLGFVAGVLPPSAYLPKSTTGVRMVQQPDGSIEAVEVTTITKPTIPGGQASGTSSGTGRVRPTGQTVGGKIPAPVNKQFEAMQDAESNYKMMERSVNDISEGKPPGPHDMLILSRHLAMTLGAVKGARLGRDLIEHHLKARSLPEGMSVLANRILEGGQLSPQQRREFLSLAKDRWDQEKRKYEEVRTLYTKDGRGKTLDEETARQILQEAGGNKAKARAIAKQRGYIVE